MTSSKPKIKPFPPWQTNTSDGKERSYFRLGRSFLENESVLALSSGAFQTYCYMLQAAKGQKEFIYPKGQYLRVCASEAFERRKKELIRGGFIKISENGNNIVGKATLYAFSDEWKINAELTPNKQERQTKRLP